MKTIHLCVLLILLSPAALQDTSLSSCSLKRKCRDCIIAGCQWCADPSIVKGSSGRCFPAGLKHSKCGKEYIYPKRELQPLEIKQNDSFRTNILFQPQKVNIKLNVGEKFTLNFTYKHSFDYPVDLYYVMDLSNSMKIHKNKLSELGGSLAITMQRLTRDFRLGFGSFVDKVEMPYTSTLKSQLENPCTEVDPCAPPYSFKNHLKLDNNTGLFSMKVNEAQVSANLDYPEGGLDAIMQAIVCKNQIGWRDNARHLLVFSTDAHYHIAGDGRLAGLIEPNDMQCYVSSNGEYTNGVEFDYPSISQVNQVAKLHNINLIFAVTKDHVTTYKSLASCIEGASAGELADNSYNVIELVEKEYKKILGSVGLSTTADTENIQVQINSLCDGRVWEKSGTCDGVKQEQEINFSATIQVTKCPSDVKEKWRETFQIKPKAVDNSITVSLEVTCDCPCENPGKEGYIPNAPDCSRNGNSLCGVCECKSGFYGDKCQCEGKKFGTAVNNNADNEDLCKKGNDTAFCSGYGICECGVCKCNARPNPEEHYYGQYCECDDFTCPRYGGLICSGPNKGTCECGHCKCKVGWTGHACQCLDNKETCIEPGKKEECSGRGYCECGTCKCNTTEDANVRYSGQYCEECPSCPGQQCENYGSLVECRVFGSGSLSKEECSSDKFPDITIIEVDRIEEQEDDIRDDIRVCSVVDNAGCTFIFRYMIGNRTLEVQRTKMCASGVNVLALVLGLIGGIVLMGLLLLLIWKIITSIHDSREFEKFEKDRAASKWDRGDNPLYNPATSQFTNPTFEPTAAKEESSN